MNSPASGLSPDGELAAVDCAELLARATWGRVVLSVRCLPMTTLVSVSASPSGLDIHDPSPTVADAARHHDVLTLELEERRDGIDLSIVHVTGISDLLESGRVRVATTVVSGQRWHWEL
jgi:hypothetical protein